MGLDLVGVIEEVGEEVKDLEVGQRVIAFPKSGCEVTSHKVKKLLEGSALTIYEIPKRGAAQARRQIVRKAVNNSDADYYHYCDLDH